MKRLILVLAALSILAVVPSAYADKHHKGSSREKHYRCYKDGQLIDARGRKQCRAAGGTWEKQSTADDSKASQ